MFHIKRRLLVGLSMLSSPSISFSFVVSASDANRAVSSSCCLATLLLDHHLAVGQDVLHEVVGTTELIFIFDSCFQIDAVTMQLLSLYFTNFKHIVGSMLANMVKPPY